MFNDFAVGPLVVDFTNSASEGSNADRCAAGARLG
jgi:hypothetical protein